MVHRVAKNQTQPKQLSTHAQGTKIAHSMWSDQKKKKKINGKILMK